MSSENSQLVQRAFDELWNQGRLEIADEIFAAGYINHDPASPDFGQGSAAEKQMVAHYRSAFPDLRFALALLVESGDFVTARFTAQGTHKNEFLGIAPTNRPVRVEGTAVYLVLGGRIAERWAVWDALGLMQQLGVVPALDERVMQASKQAAPQRGL
jgi:predicted ester cyclase